MTLRNYRPILFAAAVLLLLCGLSLITLNPREKSTLAKDSAQPALGLIVNTAHAGPDCEAAQADCGAKADFEMWSCLTLANNDGQITYNEYQACQGRSVSVLEGCMRAWGCPIQN